MSKNLVITIGREFGSMGHEIARRLSEIMGIKLYDKELLSIVAKNHGYSEDILHEIDETATNSFLYALSTGAHTHHSAMLHGIHMPMTDRAFIACSQVIKELAEEESCIILGRCGDSVLKDHENLFRVFIHADMDERANRISEFEKISKNEAVALIKKNDKKRANYLNFYAETKWGNAKTYDLCINSAIGVEKAAEIIKYAATHK
ncbi:MAG: cytidylate kinase-like family protein [Clostridia bacterium]|nr:cytidylate kinase-like family protein [Clostridia bacterium]